MIGKPAGRRMFLMICVLIALPLALIFSWMMIRSGEENEIGMRLPEDPVSKNGVSRASLAGAGKISGDMSFRAKENSERSDAAAKSLSEGRDLAGKSTEGFPEASPLPGIVTPLGLRLAGTLIEVGKNARAILIELDTGRQGLYREGDSIIGATVRKIGTDSVVLEKNGAFQVLRITDSEFNNPVADSAVGRPPAGEISARFPNIDPLESAEEPPVNTDVEVKELPYFQPFTNSTGPPVGTNVGVSELPFFQPIVNSTGPPVDPGGDYEDLPEFTPQSSENGPE